MITLNTDWFEIPWKIAVSLTYTILGIFSVFVAKYQKIAYAMLLKLPRDLLGCHRYWWVKVYTKLTLWTNQTMYSMFDRTATKKPHQVCWYFEDEVWTYKKVQNESYRMANYFQGEGLKKGDCVALLMENRPEFALTWLSLGRIGTITALLNWNLRHESLSHCVKISKCKALVYGSELESAVEELLEEGGLEGIQLYWVEDRNTEKRQPSVSSAKNLKSELKKFPSTHTKTSEKIGALDPLVYVYTSGTTGLPKASILKNSRAIMFTAMYIMQGMKQSDVLMTPIPLYHLLGGISGVGLSFCFGIPQLIVRKFSASKFWKEAVKYDVTICQYLGELIRYVYNQPDCEEATRHKIRFFFGNGVNPGIWPKFVNRFNTRIQEMYGSTEGNANIINFEGHIGAAGFVPLFVWPFIPAGVIRVSEKTGEIIRDPETGLAIECDFGEPGEFVGCIRRGDSLRQFDGYTDPESTEKKIARDVFHKGDMVFRTGDILERDIYGYLYFKDRFGDTFRWKGENVSTAEVEGVVVRGAAMKAAVVYGVQIPGTEGRCGMATIADPEVDLDLEKLAAEIIRSLPKYARPLFIRINSEIKMTGTFKLQKLELQKEGFDINRIKDKLYFLQTDKFVPLDSELHEKILTGSIRL